tara:strand:- start:1 stop:2289 length:2289 start_codon:yes stop_codon:yes gene_type:complete
MKIAEYQQMMDYLTGPRERFNGGGSVRNKTILPKKKPEEEVKKRKIKNFEKLRSVLENPEEVKKMIDKPKRGLVDEPGSYSGRRKRAKGEFDIKIEKLKKIKNDYLKFVKDSLKKGDLSKVGLFREYVRKNYPERFNAIYSAYGDRKIPRPNKEVLFKARNILAKKLVVNPNLTLKQITFKLTGGLYASLKGVPGLNVDSLPKPKYKTELGQGLAKKVKGEVDQLLKSKIITDKLKANKFPTISDVSKVLKSDPTVSETRLTDLANTLQDSSSSQKIKNLASNYLEQTTDQRTPGGKKARYLYERRFKDLMNLETTLPNIRRNILNKITNFIPQLKGLLSVDEIGSLTASMRRGSGPYAIFGQVLGSDFNEVAKGNTIDGIKSLTQKKINSLPIDSPERLKEIKKYNAKVDAFEAEANKNNPTKKVKGQKISLKPPSETIKNKKVYNQYKDLFDDHYKKYGYSFEVAADTDSIPDIAKKLDNKAFQKTIKNRFTKLISKGGKFGALVAAGTLAGTGFALADQPDTATELVDEVALTKGPTGFPTKTEAGAALAAATAGTKTGRSLFSKAFKGLDRFLLRPLTAIEAPTLAIPQSLYQTYKLGSDIAKGQQTGVSAADITLPTSLSSFAASKKFGLDLFADNAGRIRRFLRGPFTQTGIRALSRGSVFATPFIEAGIQGYNAYKALKEADKKADISEPRVDTALGKAPISYYNKIMSQLPAVDRFGAAGGGIMKMAGKSSGPAPESGPTPQGLDFLMKRGRQY